MGESNSAAVRREVGCSRCTGSCPCTQSGEHRNRQTAGRAVCCCCPVPARTPCTSPNIRGQVRRGDLPLLPGDLPLHEALPFDVLTHTLIHTRSRIPRAESGGDSLGASKAKAGTQNLGTAQTVWRP